ncbi:MAG: tyrosine-type recombinase/integrase, partial [Actinomycetota bacterium]
IRGDRLYALGLVYLTTGARKGEVAALKWEVVDLDGGEMRIVRSRSTVGYRVYETRGKRECSRRRIELDALTVAALKSWRARQLEERLAAGPAWEETGYVFTNRQGQPMHPDSIYRMLRRRVERAGLPWIGIKGMRHTWATLALASGEQIKVVAERLGHSSIKTTGDVYQHCLPGMQREAAERVADLIFRPNA